MRWIVGMYAASFIYAVMRYVVFDPKNLDNLPAYVTNKGVAMAAALCFVVGVLARVSGRGDADSESRSTMWFRAGVFGVIWHVPMALVVLRPAYFGEFFVGEVGEVGRLRLAGELVFFFGGLAAGVVYLLTRQGWSVQMRWRLSLAVMALLAGHVLAMGYCRGLNVTASHGFLPPMWLLSAIGVGVGVVGLMMRRPRG